MLYEKPLTADEIIGITENILFAAGEAVSVARIAQALEVEEEEYRQIIRQEIQNRSAKAGLMLVLLEDHLQLCTRKEDAQLLFSLFGEKTEEDLSRAMLETLSIVAYKQPVTRAEIEELRGVNTSCILNNLLEKGLIVEAGRKETLGRPILYATSLEFLRHFGISGLEELPKIS